MTSDYEGRDATWEPPTLEVLGDLVTLTGAGGAADFDGASSSFGSLGSL